MTRKLGNTVTNPDGSPHLERGDKDCVMPFSNIGSEDYIPDSGIRPGLRCCLFYKAELLKRNIEMRRRLSKHQVLSPAEPWKRYYNFYFPQIVI